MYVNPDDGAFDMPCIWHHSRHVTFIHQLHTSPVTGFRNSEIKVFTFYHFSFRVCNGSA